jgi:hypothetical protein
VQEPKEFPAVEEPPTPELSADTPEVPPKAQGSRLANIKEKGNHSSVSELRKMMEVPVSTLEMERDYLQLTAETIQETWYAAVNHIRSYAGNAFIDIAERVLVSWEDPATITVEVDSKLSEGLLNENKMQLSSGLRHVSGRTDFEICIVLNRKHGYEVKVKKHLSPREKFRLMAEQYPAILDLQKRLDLDLL